MQLVPGLAVVLLGALVLVMSGRAIATATSALGDTFTSGADGAAVPVVALGSTLPNPPISCIAPASEYTNVSTVIVSGTLPSGLPPTDTVRLYRIGQSNVLVAQVAVGPLPEFKFAKVPLILGVNDFSATIAGPTGETAQSGPIRIVYSTTKPKVVVASPARGSIITSPTVTVVGSAPAAGSAVVVREQTYPRAPVPR